MNTPKGKGEAFGVLDYGKEDHLIWVIALDVSGKIWAFPNPEVRFNKNPTIGRNEVDSLSAG